MRRAPRAIHGGARSTASPAEARGRRRGQAAARRPPGRDRATGSACAGARRQPTLPHAVRRLEGGARMAHRIIAPVAPIATRLVAAQPARWRRSGGRRCRSSAGSPGVVHGARSSCSPRSRRCRCRAAPRRPGPARRPARRAVPVSPAAGMLAGRCGGAVLAAHGQALSVRRAAPESLDRADRASASPTTPERRVVAPQAPRGDPPAQHAAADTAATTPDAATDVPATPAPTPTPAATPEPTPGSTPTLTPGPTAGADPRTDAPEVSPPP